MALVVHLVTYLEIVTYRLGFNIVAIDSVMFSIEKKCEGYWLESPSLLGFFVSLFLNQNCPQELEP